MQEAFSAETRDWKDEKGIWWREVISRSYGHLRDLQSDYRAKGLKSWLYPFDASNQRYVLSIMGVRP